jgi:tRNA G18 (ribose-2'-O)-methylase SpoU
MAKTNPHSKNKSQDPFFQQFNVVPQYFGWTQDLIKEKLRETAFPYSVLMTQISHDFNFGTLVRCSNAFNAGKVYYFGNTRKFDPRGAVGTHHYMEPVWIDTFEKLKNLKNQYTFVGIDNIEGSVELEKFEWPENTLMIFGEEQIGIIPEILELCDYKVYIPMFGSVRSLNVGTASGIVMNDFVTKHNQKNKK